MSALRPNTTQRSNPLPMDDDLEAVIALNYSAGSIDEAGVVTPGSKVSTANSVLDITLDADEVWLGEYEEITSWSLITYAHNGAPADAAGTVQFEFSFDGTQVDVTAGSLQNTGVGLSAPHTLIPVGRYLRLRYTNGSTPLTNFRLQTMLHSSKSGKLTRFPIQTLTDYDDVDFVRSIISAKNPSGIYQNVGLTQGGALRVEDDRQQVGLFGDLATSGRIEEVAVSYHDPADFRDLITKTVSGGATVTNPDSQLVIESGTAGTSSATVVSDELILYRPGNEIAALFTAAWEVPGVANSTMKIGLFDENNGIWIGYEGSTFGVGRRRDGVDTFTPRSSFNYDLLTGESTSTFTRDGVPEAIDLTKVNIFRGKFGWLGSAPIIFEVLSADGGWVPFHLIHQPNTSVDVSILNPDLPIRVEVTKTGADATNLKFRSGSWSGSVRGVNHQSIISTANSTADALGSSGVFTGDWLNIEHHSAIAVTVLADQVSATHGLEVQFSTDATNVTRSVPFTYNTPDEALSVTLGAVMQFCRIKYTNGGTPQGSMVLQTKFVITALQNPTVNIDGELGDAQPAVVNRSVVSGKKPDLSYGNVELTASNNFKVNIEEATAEVPQKSLSTIETNQSNVTTVAALIIAPTANRRSISIRALTANGQKIYIGNTGAITTGNGYELAAGAAVDIDLDETQSIYMISNSGTQRICWMEAIKA